MKYSRQKKNSLHDIPGASRSIYSQRCSYISAIIFLAEFDRKGTEKIGLEPSNNAYETIPKGKTNKRRLNMKHIANIALLVGVLLLVGLIGTIIYCWCTYANAPITDIPAWAIFFMWGGIR